MEIREYKKEIYTNAIRSLASYKFIMFGYYAAIWVYLNKMDPRKERNPFTDFVKLARDIAVEKVS